MSKRQKQHNLKADINKISDEVLRIFRHHKTAKTLNYREISAKLDIKDTFSLEMIMQVLEKLERQQILEQVKPGAYKLRQTGDFVEGRIEINQKGFGFVSVEGRDGDIFIPESKMLNALPKDLVKVKIKPKRGASRGNTEGEIVEVVSRFRSQFVGIVHIKAQFAFLVPDNKDMPVDILIPLEKLNGARDGQKAIAIFQDWPINQRNPEGEITEVLGAPGEHDTEMMSLVAEFGFPLYFPEEVIAEAERFSLQIPAAEIKNRRDFRGITTFTIDPVDAKDFDDAISVQYLKGNIIEVGVHIADVSHYVRPGSALDKEAFRRATSVYLVDRVVPMLPENLSNMVCSLRPDEEKLTFSAVFQLDENGQILDEWFGRTIIRSNRRFAYEEVQEILEKGEGDYVKELKDIDQLAHKLRDERFRKGSIRFESEELRFKLDENGKPLSVFVKERKEAHMLIEDFMLLANRRVAAFIAYKDKGKFRNNFVYRVHDAPDLDRLKRLANFVERFGYEVNYRSRKEISESLNRLVEELEGKEEADIIESMAIRTMAKAVYTTANIGHYGLAFQHYTHFTSPIRRYPDVMVHRLLEAYQQEGAKIQDQTKMEKDCLHSSERERAAVQAERASTKYKQIEMLQDKVGQEFDAIIAEIKEFGFYVVIDYNHCDGLVRFSTMTDARYFFDEETYTIRGNRSMKPMTLGDKVRVKLMKADLRLRQADFNFVPQK